MHLTHLMLFRLFGLIRCLAGIGKLLSPWRSRPVNHETLSWIPPNLDLFNAQPADGNHLPDKNVNVLRQISISPVETGSLSDDTEHVRCNVSGRATLSRMGE